MTRARRVSVPAIAACLYIALILPSDFSVIIGGLRLTPYRVLLLIITIPLLIRLLQNTRQPPHVVDYLVIAHAVWVVLALIVRWKEFDVL